MEIPDHVLKKWQNIVNTMAVLIGVPAGLIMRIDESDIEVLVSSQTKDNPYHPGEREQLFGSGLYCERVIRTRQELLVPNALSDEDWKDNPDVKLNMISYLGLPLLLPNGTPFGTICVLDNKENPYSKTYIDLIRNFRDNIENNLELLYVNHILGVENRRLIEYVSETKILRGTLEICRICKSVKDDKGHWHMLEEYISKHSEAAFSHCMCPECEKKETL